MTLNINNITKSFGGVLALKKSSFELNENDILGLIGPNGAGKTTLFNIITGNYKPDNGEILLNKKKIDGLNPHSIVRKGIARTFQNIRLFKSLTVLENVLIGFDFNINYSFFEAIIRLGRFFNEEKKAKKKAYEILESLNMKKYAHFKANNLSYGEQRKVEIARALATNPRILLLDEPVAGMNPSESKDLGDIILKLKNELKISVLIIEHDMKFVNNICTKVLVLDYGKIIFEGKPEEAIKDKNVISAYLGDFNDQS